LRTYEGRVPLRSYLVGFALDHLVLEWKRQERVLDTVSLETLAEQQPGWEASVNPEPAAHVLASTSWEEALARLPLEKAVVLKLLHVEDAEFSPTELRHLAKASGKKLAEVVGEIERLRSLVRERESNLRRLEDQLEAVQGWIRLYRRRLARLCADQSAMDQSSASAGKIAAERSELERKLCWREQQRQRLVQQLRGRKVTAPYKEIARLLGTTVGNVASQILRVRKEVARYLSAVGPLPHDKHRGA
jgi:DNA-directed RNA polymerase specialized sigma24 family protein